MDYSVVKKPVVSGAARQIYGSSSLRTVSNKQPKRRKNNQYVSSTTRKPVFHEYEEDDYDDFGVLITQPHPVPPPFDSSIRVLGGGRVPGTGLGIDSDLYGSRSLGERHGDEEWKTWDRYDHNEQMGHHIGIRPNQPIMDTESRVMQMPSGGSHMIDDDNDERQPEIPCTLGCLNSEFLCSHSCMCIPKHKRCDGELDCDLNEDEEDCKGVSNIDVIRAIKRDCEASDHHVMCPKTFACIAKEFLCDGDGKCLHELLHQAHVHFP